jgi:hypothetical protein
VALSRAPVGLVEGMEQMDDAIGRLMEGVDDRCEHVFEPRSAARTCS